MANRRNIHHLTSRQKISSSSQLARTEESATVFITKRSTKLSLSGAAKTTPDMVREPFSTAPSTRSGPVPEPHGARTNMTAADTTSVAQVSPGLITLEVATSPKHRGAIVQSSLSEYYASQ